MKPEQIIREALLSPIYSELKQTNLDTCSKLSRTLGRKVQLKREDQQPIFSFKIRGALHKMLTLPEKKRASGVAAGSAGNHAQGVAYAAKHCGVPAHIFMPRTTTPLKIHSVEGLGAKVHLNNDGFNEAVAGAKEMAAKHQMNFFHPFNDHKIISGQATAGIELLQQLDKNTEAIFVCCGGGGLLAGIATVIKHYQPKIKVIGVEPDDAPTITESLNAGKIIDLPYVGKFAETAAVPKTGPITFELCQRYVDDMMLVDSASICKGIKEIYEDTRVIAEPAGALAVAGLREYAQKRRGTRPLAATISGANMNFDALRYVVERTQSGRAEMLLGAEIPERPNSFLELCRLLGKRRVTEFNYRYSQKDRAHIFAGIELENDSERATILSTLQRHGIAAVDLSGDETAELHVRHMVGGRSSAGIEEQTYRIEFPETSGALVKFLSSLKGSFNISLFHYRFHGTNVGWVMVGFQAPASKRTALEKELRQIGYPFWRIDRSAAYEMFLADPAAGGKSKKN